MNRQTAGFTLIEVSAILVAVLVLVSLVIVNVGDFNRLARFSRVRDDVARLCSSLAQLVLDAGDLATHGVLDPNTTAGVTPVGLLIGDGDAPGLNARSPGAAGAPWLLDAGAYFEQPADFSGNQYRFAVDTLANHLVHNTPLGTTRLNYTAAAPGAGEADNLFAWRGPYVARQVDADPWGNRYMANVFSLYVPAGIDTGGFRSAVVCYSAGADEEVDTEFNQPGEWVNGDDDVSAFVALEGRL